MEEQVTFKNGTHQLVGSFHTPDNRKGNVPGILLCHGFTGSKSESHFIFTKLARRLAQNGLAVLRFDFFGSGDSDGDFEKMTINTEKADGAAALAFLRERREIAPDAIGALGLSSGAVTAVALAAKFPFISSLCLWAPLAHPSIFSQKLLTRRMKKQLQEKGTIYLQNVGFRMGKRFFAVAATANPLADAARYTGAALIIQAKDDQTLSLDHGMSYFRSFHSNARDCQFLVLAEGGHTFRTEFSEEKVITETVGFFSGILPSSS